MVAIFTPDELKQFKVVQLKRLADYYNVAYNKVISKKDLIEKLKPLLCDPEVDNSEPEQPMSVRVRRIYEASRKELNNG